MPVVVATADVYEEADLVCQQILEARDKDVAAGRDGRPLSQPLRQRRAPGRAGVSGHPLHRPQRTAVLRAGPHQGRAGLPAGRGQPARRGLVAAASAALAGDRPGEGGGGLSAAGGSGRSPGGAGIGRDDGRGPDQEPGTSSRRSWTTSGRSRRPTRSTIPRRRSRRSSREAIPHGARAEVRPAGEPARRPRAVRRAGRQVRQPGAAARRAAPGRRRLRHGYASSPPIPRTCSS